jgi:hypothetical protein
VTPYEDERFPPRRDKVGERRNTWWVPLLNAYICVQVENVPNGNICVYTEGVVALDDGLWSRHVRFLLYLG